jgi:hypothetical protein
MQTIFVASCLSGIKSKFKNKSQWQQQNLKLSVLKQKKVH